MAVPGCNRSTPTLEGWGVVTWFNVRNSPRTFAFAKFDDARPKPSCDRAAQVDFDPVHRGCLLGFEGHYRTAPTELWPAANWSKIVGKVLKKPGLTQKGTALLLELQRIATDKGVSMARLLTPYKDELMCGVVIRPGCKSSVDVLHFNALSFTHDKKNMIINSRHNHDFWMIDISTMRVTFGFKASSELWQPGSYNLRSTAHMPGSKTFDNDGAAFYNHGTHEVIIKPGGGQYQAEVGVIRVLLFNNGMQQLPWQRKLYRGNKNSVPINPLIYDETNAVVDGQTARCVEVEVRIPTFDSAGKLRRKGTSRLVWSATFEDIHESDPQYIDPLLNQTTGSNSRIEGFCQRLADGATAISWGLDFARLSPEGYPVVNRPVFSVIQTWWLPAGGYKNLPLFGIEQTASQRNFWAARFEPIDGSGTVAGLSLE